MNSLPVGDRRHGNQTAAGNSKEILYDNNHGNDGHEHGKKNVTCLFLIDCSISVLCNITHFYVSHFQTKNAHV